MIKIMKMQMIINVSEKNIAVKKNITIRNIVKNKTKI